MNFQAQGPVVIPGLDRHLELQDLAKQQAMDLQQRQAKAFKLNPQPGPFMATVPAPFRFKADDNSVSPPHQHPTFPSFFTIIPVHPNPLRNVSCR